MPKKIPALATVVRGLFDGIKSAYENIGYSIIHSLIWTFLHLPFWMALFAALENFRPPNAAEGAPLPWVLIVLALLLTGAFLAAPANAGLLYVARLIKEEDARIRDFFIGFKRYFWRAAKVYASCILAAVFLVADIGAAARLGGLIARVSMVIAGYFLIFVVLLSNYLFPLLVLQDNTWKKVWKKAMLLTLDNGLLTLLLTLFTGLFYAASIIFSFLLAFFYPSAMAYGHYRIFESLLAKYDDEETPAPESGGS